MNLLSKKWTQNKLTGVHGIKIFLKLSKQEPFRKPENSRGIEQTRLKKELGLRKDNQLFDIKPYQDYLKAFILGCWLFFIIVGKS